MSNGIADKVDGNLAEAGFVALHNDRARYVEHNRPSWVGGRDVSHDIANNSTQVNRLIFMGSALVESSQ
jgi:hypothetical protein